jgi:cytochrome c5
MNKIKLLFAVLGCVLLLFGCSQEEGTSGEQTPAKSVEQTEKTSKSVEQAEKAVEQVKQKATEVAEQAEEKAKQVQQQAVQKVDEVKEQAAEQVDKVEQQVSAMANKVTGATSGTTASNGEGIYAKSCASCHKMGIIGAPKTGDQAAWKPLISSGISELTQAVINGKGAMPARGGNSSLSDDEIRAAVEYMVEQSR